MIKNKLDFKMINATLLIFSVYLIYQTKDFWINAVSLIWKIILPFVIAFAIAYALYPLVRKLMNKNVPKGVSITIVVGGLLCIIGFMLILSAPFLIDQVRSLFNGIVAFLKQLSIDYGINFKTVQDNLSGNFNNILKILGNYISNGAVSVISISFDYLSKIFIIFTSFVYFLIDMDKIRKVSKEFLKSKSDKIYNYFKLIDDEMEKYLSGFLKIIFISFVEYSVLYSLIGHPNSLLLGGLAAFSNLIPYFGGIIVNIIAAITAFVISPELFMKTCIVFIVCSGVDGNVINPLVYGKTNKVHPLIVITSVFAGGILFGVIGIVISLPLSIILISTYKYFKSDLIKIKNKRIKK
ncbi:MAG: AI-2E family transporter [Bacilli bacterium]|nr:AI-2E family transporter [Bacilli bacterium]